MTIPSYFKSIFNHVCRLSVSILDIFFLLDEVGKDFNSFDCRLCISIFLFICFQIPSAPTLYASSAVSVPSGQGHDSLVRLHLLL